MEESKEDGAMMFPHMSAGDASNLVENYCRPGTLRDDGTVIQGNRLENR